MSIATIAGRVLDLAAASGFVDQSPIHRGLISNATTPAATGTTPTGAAAWLFNRNAELQIDNAYVTSTQGSFAGTSTAALVDGDNGTVWLSAVNTFPIDVVTYHPGGAVVTGYGIRVNTTSGGPNTWKFQGSNDGTTWTDLDSQAGVTWTSSGERKAYTFANTTSYAIYRTHITAGNGDYMRWQGIDYTGATPALLGSNRSGHFFAVVKTLDTSGGGMWQWGTSGSTNHYSFGGVVYDDMGTNVRKSFTPTLDIASTYRVYEVEINGTALVARLDGVDQFTATVTPAWSLRPTLGSSLGGGQPYYGYGARFLEFDRALSSTDAATVRSELTSLYISAPTGVTGTVAGTAPKGVGSLTGSVPPPPITGTAAGTSPAGAGSLTGTAPTTGTVAGTSPSGVGSLTGTSDNTTTGTIAGTSPSGSGSLTGSVPSTGTIAGSSPAGFGSLTGTVTPPPAPGVVYISAPSPAHGALTSLEVFTPSTEVLLLSAPSPCDGSLRVSPVAAPVPAWITDRPITRRAHLMAPKTAANPRKRGDELRAPVAGDDGYNYPIEVSDIGRLRVFASGVDVTYLTGAPTTVSEWSFAKPFGPQAASFTVPLREWQEPGDADLSMLWADASIEITLEDTTGTLWHLWDGFTSEESDTAAPGQTGVTWNCEGTLQQAALWPWDPTAYRGFGPRDVGHVIADALNSVPNRRYAKVKRFTTGVLTDARGDSSQSVLAFVAELIGSTFDADGRTLFLKRFGPFVYQLAWCPLPTDEVRWTFTKGSPGFAMTLTRPHNARRDAVFARGIAPDGGFWMNRMFPGLAAASPPVYPMAGFANISVGTTDAGTSTGNGVTTWQRRMRELGYPVTVDGVMNSADTAWVEKIQRDRGITVDGSLGPQTWAATWEGGAQVPETDSWRAPLSQKDSVRPFNYDASGRFVAKNPAYDPKVIIHAMPEIDAGTNMKKSTFQPMARRIRQREGEPGYVGSLTATGVDPHEVDASRLFIIGTHNVLVDGHHGATIVQCSDVTHTPTTTRMTVDSGARGQALVDAIMSRQRDVRRSLSGKSTRVTDRGALNSSQLGQFESESPAGKFPRTAINGDSGLWTVRCIYVAEQGLARFRLTSSPAAEIVTTIWDQPVTPNYIAGRVPHPLTDDSGWYDHEKELKAAGLIDVAGTPDSPGGYFPWQKSDGHGITGVQAVGNLSMKSKRGGFFWIGVYTSRSAFVEGEFEPEVPTS